MLRRCSLVNNCRNNQFCSSRWASRVVFKFEHFDELFFQALQLKSNLSLEEETRTKEQARLDKEASGFSSESKRAVGELKALAQQDTAINADQKVACFDPAENSVRIQSMKWDCFFQVADDQLELRTEKEKRLTAFIRFCFLGSLVLIFFYWISCTP